MHVPPYVHLHGLEETLTLIVSPQLFVRMQHEADVHTSRGGVYSYGPASTHINQAQPAF